jgi:hypothetical protein
MKLNGWQRAGVVASLVWIPSAYYCAHRAAAMDDRKFAGENLTTCDEVYTTLRRDLSECQKNYESYLNATQASERTQALKVALTPVPIGWILGYATVWIKRGFVDAKPS